MERKKPYTPRRQIRLEPALYAESNRVYFFTVRGYGKRPPFPSAEMAQSVVTVLSEQAEATDCSVFTYCIMPDHVHFLARPNTDGVSVLTFVDRFKGKTTNASWRLGWRGKLWQPRYYDHIVRTDENLKEIADYILGNPVRKGLVESLDDWPWSGHLNPLPLE